MKLFQGGTFQQLKSIGKCLTAEGCGTYSDQWDCVGTDGAPHQSWILDTIDPPISLKGILRNYAFNTKCLHPVGQDNGAEHEIVDCSKVGSDQIIRTISFQVKCALFSYFKYNNSNINVDLFHRTKYKRLIKFDLNGKSLSLNGFGSDNGVHILLWECVGQDNQKWSIVN